MSDKNNLPPGWGGSDVDVPEAWGQPQNNAMPSESVSETLADGTQGAKDTFNEVAAGVSNVVDKIPTEEITRGLTNAAAGVKSALSGISMPKPSIPKVPFPQRKSNDVTAPVQNESGVADKMCQIFEEPETTSESMSASVQPAPQYKAVIGEYDDFNTEYAPKNPKAVTGLVIPILAVVLVIGGIIGGVYLFGDDDEGDSPVASGTGEDSPVATDSDEDIPVVTSGSAFSSRKKSGNEST